MTFVFLLPLLHCHVSWPSLWNFHQCKLALIWEQKCSIIHDLLLCDEINDKKSWIVVDMGFKMNIRWTF